ncbi:MAG TPA: FixH family protein [Acidobacteriota bacterium]|nr:FixH family protein [Acidobacteriota bacterium]
MVAAALLLQGCGDVESAEADPREGLYLKQNRTSSNRNFLVSYRTRPHPLPLNQRFAMEIEVAPRPGRQPGQVRAVSVHAQMPAHNHGMYVRPKVLSQSDGLYRVEGMLFHMAGHWKLNVDIEHGPFVERAVFDVFLE